MLARHKHKPLSWCDKKNSSASAEAVDDEAGADDIDRLADTAVW